MWPFKKKSTLSHAHSMRTLLIPGMRGLCDRFYDKGVVEADLFVGGKDILVLKIMGARGQMHEDGFSASLPTIEYCPKMLSIFNDAVRKFDQTAMG